MGVVIKPRPFFDDKLRSRDLAGFTLAETLYPPRLSMPRHAHETARFGFVLQGGYTEYYGRRVRTCAPSSLVFHPPGEDHAVNFHEPPTRIFDVKLKPRWFDDARGHTGALARPHELNGGLAMQLAVRLYREFSEPDEASPLIIEGLVLEILGVVSRHAGTTRRQSPRWLACAREMLREGYAAPPDVAHVAAAVGVHPVHLAREFRRRYGCTMGEYVRRLRVESACRSLSASDAPLAQIAAASGFYDQSHFSRVFKRQTGLAPGAYRATFRRR